MKDKARSRRNLILFWVHLALAGLVLAWFVYAVANK